MEEPLKEKENLEEVNEEVQTELNEEQTETEIAGEAAEEAATEAAGTEGAEAEAAGTESGDEDAETEAADGEAEENIEESGQENAGEPVKKERKLKWARGGKGESKPDPIEEKLREANDKYARLFAEFDNFRKRTDKEKAQRYDFGARDMVERILPVIDNFERGLAAVSAEQAEDSFVKGMEMTYKQLLKVLEDAGVKPIEAVGQEFNPDFHNAVMHVDDPEVGDNIIVEEFQKGYMYKDHVVRYSMVKVAN